MSYRKGKRLYVKFVRKRIRIGGNKFRAGRNEDSRRKKEDGGKKKMEDGGVGNKAKRVGKRRRELTEWSEQPRLGEGREGE